MHHALYSKSKPKELAKNSCRVYITLLCGQEQFAMMTKSQIRRLATIVDGNNDTGQNE